MYHSSTLYQLSPQSLVTPSLVKMEPSADPRHPLAQAYIEKCVTIHCGEGTGKSNSYVNCESLLWNGKLCVSTLTMKGPELKTEMPKLFIYSTEDEWKLVTEYELDYTHSALCTYQSRLLSIGGRETHKRDERGFYIPVNKVLVTDDGTNWEEFSPPMPSERYEVTAVNLKHPTEMVVVMGGVERITCTGAVEILFEKQWTRLRQMPMRYFNIKHTIHNGGLFVWGRKEGFNPHIRGAVTYCRLSNLETAFRSSLAAADEDDASIIDINWQYINTTPCYRHRRAEGYINIFQQGETLLSIGTEDFNIPTFHYYSAYPPLWVPSGVLPARLGNVTCIVLETGQLILMGQEKHKYADFVLHKVNFRVPVYEPFAKLHTSSLYRLEAAKVPVLSALARNLEQLHQACQVPLPPPPVEEPAVEGRVVRKDRPNRDIKDDRDTAAECLEQWRRKTPECSWKTLFGLLRGLGLDELCAEIEHHLCSPRSLKDLSMQVIMSGLLHQTMLEGDQLEAGLPDYVPTSVKRYIVDCFTADTHKELDLLHKPFTRYWQYRI